MGVTLAGLLGGLVSSTAVTLQFSRRSAEHPQQATALALGILIAWTVMFAPGGGIGRGGRLGARAPDRRRDGGPRRAELGDLRAPLAPAVRRSTPSTKPGENPFALGQAIRFGAIFGLVTFMAKAARVYLGDGGLYLAAAVAGLTDVDAIALSMAHLARADAIERCAGGDGDRHRGARQHALQGRHGGYARDAGAPDDDRRGDGRDRGVRRARPLARAMRTT